MEATIIKEKVAYNYELLLKVLERDGAKINEELFKNEKINREKRIDFICSCGKEGNKFFRSCNEKGAYCKECANIRMINKQKETSLLLYGVDNPSKSIQIKQKIKDVCLKKFGVENPSKLDEIKEKIKKTNLERYGVEHIFKLDSIKEKARDTNLEIYGSIYSCQSEEIKEKIRKTNLEKYGVEQNLKVFEIREKRDKTIKEKYGVDNISQLDSVKKKKEETCLKNYGVKHPGQSEQLKEKIVKTNLQKYGKPYTLQVEEIRNKGIQTNLKKYGFEHPQQNAECAEEYSKKSYKLKSYIFPSGKEIKVQGYENIALDFLIDRGYNEDDIVTNRTEVPEIWWVNKNNKKSRYYVDIFIKSENKFIEVKSPYTFTKNKEKMEKTKEAVKEKGYLYELWLINKGKIIEVIN
jgi:hypothetical protein